MFNVIWIDPKGNEHHVDAFRTREDAAGYVTALQLQTRVNGEKRTFEVR